MSKLNLNKPLTVNGRQAGVIHTFSNGSVVVVVENETVVRQFNTYGRPIDGHFGKLINAPEQIVKHFTFYPQTGQTYTQDGPIKSSQYGLDQVVNLRLTYEDGVLIKKEII